MSDSRYQERSPERVAWARSPVPQSPVALFQLGMGRVVVAVALQEAEVVRSHQLDGLEPLGALPEVLAGHQGAQWPAVLGGQVGSVVGPDHRALVLAGERDGDAGGEAAAAV